MRSSELSKRGGKTIYFFVNHLERPTFLICNEFIAVNKEYNIKRHYESKHKSYSELVFQARKDKLDRPKSLKKQSFCITKKGLNRKIILLLASE